MVPRPQKPPVQPYDPTQRHSLLAGHQEKLIGKVIVAWSKLESALEHMIWILYDLPIEYGRIITSRLDANGRIQMLRALSPLAFRGSELQEFAELLSKIDIIREDRNFVAHGVWGRTEIFDNHLPQLVPMALSVRIKNDPTTVVGETFPEERLRVLQSTIYKLMAEVIHFQVNRSAAKPTGQPPARSPVS